MFNAGLAELDRIRIEMFRVELSIERTLIMITLRPGQLFFFCTPFHTQTMIFVESWDGLGRKSHFSNWPLSHVKGHCVKGCGFHSGPNMSKYHKYFKLISTYIRIMIIIPSNNSNQHNNNCNNNNNIY